MRQAADGNYAALRIDRGAEAESVGEIGSLARAFDALLIDLRDKDSLGATTAAAVAVEEARRHDEEREGARSRHGRSERILSFGGQATQAVPHHVVHRGDLLANRYRIEALIGSGGMGLVYRARDRVLAESVAVKLLRSEILGSDQAAREHLREELRVARRITHRNVVRTHDIGESDGLPFLSMEYVEGASLATVIRVRGSMPLPAVISVARQLMRALRAAHEQQIVHGDIKPQNLLVGADGVLKVTDFGIARVMRDALRGRVSQPSEGDGVAGRVGGAIVGTPEYLAPELLIGGPATVASDLYAAGVVLHECLVGSTPYGADTPMQFLAHKLDESPALQARPSAEVAAEARTARGVPANVNLLVAALTHPDPQQRPVSAEDVLQQLARIG
jgi:serine/threonine-protein kinase